MQSCRVPLSAGNRCGRFNGDDSLLHAIDKIWDNLYQENLCAGWGRSHGDGERYGANYELPNATAYNETCAADLECILEPAHVLLHGNAKYIDLLEKILYNGLISGIGLDGKSFFTPMQWRLEIVSYTRIWKVHVLVGSNAPAALQTCPFRTIYSRVYLRTER
jgi:DUF1680 family protein